MTEAVSMSGQDIALHRRKRGMLFRAMLAQNVGTGCAFGGLGVSVLALQDRYDASLAMATMALSLAILSLTAFGPLIAVAIGRWGLRRVMSTGVFISMVGYTALAYAPTMPIALAECGLLIGPGAALFSALPPAVLASGWYPEARGKVMGIAFLPLFVTVLPVIGVSIIQNYGLKSFFLLLAGLHLLLLPLTLTVIDPPVEAPDEAGWAEGVTSGPTQIAILSGALFWLIAVGDGILNGTAITGGAHLLPIVEGYHGSLQTGAVLLAVSGAASIVGSLVAGFACDRVGPARTLGLVGLGFAAAWAIMGMSGGMVALNVAAFLIGFCGASVFPPISALVVQLYGLDALPKVLGLLGVMTLPFSFFMSPAAGWLRDFAGSYEPVFIGVFALCAFAAAIFFGMSRYHARNREVHLDIPDAGLPPAKAA